MTVTMAKLNRAFAAARDDLASVGLLAPGRYLDRIDCVLSPLPMGFWVWREMGWVYDHGVDAPRAFVGFAPGVIYIPFNAPTDAHIPGSTLTDVIRHEFAHAWYWLDPKLVDGPWFRATFGARYADTETVATGDFDRREYASPYAMTNAKEDFAETFMTYLRNWRSLHRFAAREGVYRKLIAVDEAVGRDAASRNRILPHVGPRRVARRGESEVAELLRRRPRKRVGSTASHHTVSRGRGGADTSRRERTNS